MKTTLQFDAFNANDLWLAAKRTTQADIHARDRTSVNSLQPWCAKGLAGRGVLIDYESYAQRHGIQANYFSPHAITLEDVQAIAKEQNVQFHCGDVLFLRTGYVTAYKKLDTYSREKVAGLREWCGLGQSHETIKWLWERQFAALASDSPGFEVRRKPNEIVWRLLIYILTVSSSAGRETMAHASYHVSRMGNSTRRAV